MRNSLILLSSLIALSACQPTTPIDETDDVTSSSSAVSSSASTEDTEAASWSIIQSWSGDITWSAPVAGTNDNDIHIDERRMIPTGAIQATSVTATIDLPVYEQLFINADARTALDEALSPLGWQKHLLLEADGPTGTQWGYILEDANGVRFLIVSSLGTECTTDNEQPVLCSMFEAKVTMTTPLAPGDDL